MLCQFVLMTPVRQLSSWDITEGSNRKYWCSILSSGNFSQRLEFNFTILLTITEHLNEPNTCLAKFKGHAATGACCTASSTHPRKKISLSSRTAKHVFKRLYIVNIHPPESYKNVSKSVISEYHLLNSVPLLLESLMSLIQELQNHIVFFTSRKDSLVSGYKALKLWFKINI